jgi:hypothetical protein
MSEHTKGPRYQIETAESENHGYSLLLDGYAVADFAPDLEEAAIEIAGRLNVFPELLEALKNARIVLGEAGSNEHVKQLTDAELGRLWIAITKEADAAIAKAEGK